MLVDFIMFDVTTSMQQRVQQGLEDGARLPCLDLEKLRGENNSLREEQQRLKKVCSYLLLFLLIEVWIQLTAVKPELSY